MSIRVAREADAAAMSHVIVDRFWPPTAIRYRLRRGRSARRSGHTLNSEEGWANTLREIAADPSSKDCIYVAEAADGELVGLVMGGTAKTEGLPTTGEVYALYVLPNHQGRGLGRQLVQAVAAHLAQLGMTALHIGCLAANTPGRRFYEALGGRVVDERLVDEEGFMLPEVFTAGRIPVR